MLTTPAADSGAIAPVVVEPISGGETSVKITGELDVYTAPKLRLVLQDVIAAAPVGCTLVLDCASLSFIDSTGLGVLVATLQRARERGGDVRLRSVPRGPRKAMDIAGLTNLFSIE